MNTNTINRISTLAAAIGLAVSANTWAATTAQQEVGYTIEAFTEIVATGAGLTQTFNSTALVVDGFYQVTDSTTNSLTVTSVVGGTDKNKIDAALTGDNLPTGVTLDVTMGQVNEQGTPGTASFTSTNKAAAPILSGLTTVTGNSKITYTLKVPNTIGASTLTTQVTYTITADI